MSADPSQLIQTLALQPHPEGGYFRETYRAAESVDAQGLPSRFGARRQMATSVYFLLEAGQYSRLHRLKSDEIWYFHCGGPLEIFAISPTGSASHILLGPEPGKNQVFQAVIPHGHWFGARPAPQTQFCLVGCGVAPGFDFADFEMGTRDALAAKFPAHQKMIDALTPASTDGS